MYRSLTTFMCLLALSAHAGDLKIYSVPGDSPVGFKTASFNDELNEISASLENPSATELKSITVRGAFFKEGKRTGGFALTVPTRVYAHGYVNLHTIVATDMLSQADVLLLSTAGGDSVIAAREPLRLLDAVRYRVGRAARALCRT